MGKDEFRYDLGDPGPDKMGPDDTDEGWDDSSSDLPDSLRSNNPKLADTDEV